jgi:hypothetical protein
MTTGQGIVALLYTKKLSFYRLLNEYVYRTGYRCGSVFEEVAHI